MITNMISADERRVKSVSQDDKLSESKTIDSPTFYTPGGFDMSLFLNACLIRLKQVTGEDHSFVSGEYLDFEHDREREHILFPEINGCLPPPAEEKIDRNWSVNVINVLLPGKIKHCGISIYVVESRFNNIKGDLQWLFFYRKKDRQQIADHLERVQNKSLPYVVEAFPDEAISWLDNAEKFFSHITREKLLTHNLSQQLGVIFAGPPGCGKTLFSKLVFEKLCKNRNTALWEQVSRYGPRDILEAVKNNSEIKERGMIIFDDVEELLVERSGEDSSPALSWMLTHVDAGEKNISRLLIMITNHPEKLDDALLRPGRFDTIISFNTPVVDKLKKVVEFFTAGDCDKDTVERITEKIDKMKNKSLAHVSYLAKLVYSGVVSSWEEATDYLDEFSPYRGVKEECSVGKKKKKVGF